AALPPVEGELAVAGLSEPVEVLRDRWGIPYLSASSLDDLWFAQGFVQASERLFQIELALRAAGGRLSGWFSDLTIASDRFARPGGFHRIGGRGGGAAPGMVLGPHDRVRPVRSHGRVPQDRGTRGAALERGVAVDDAAVRR